MDGAAPSCCWAGDDAVGEGVGCAGGIRTGAVGDAVGGIRVADDGCGSCVDVAPDGTGMAVGGADCVAAVDGAGTETSDGTDHDADGGMDDTVDEGHRAHPRMPMDESR